MCFCDCSLLADAKLQNEFLDILGSWKSFVVAQIPMTQRAYKHELSTFIIQLHTAIASCLCFHETGIIMHIGTVHVSMFIGPTVRITMKTYVHVPGWNVFPNLMFLRWGCCLSWCCCGQSAK